MPFAVTDAAIRYYSAQMQQLAQIYAGRTWQLTLGDSVVQRGKARGRFEYNARVESGESGTGAEGTRVELRLVFELQCGILCGLGFSKTRTVYFSKSGAMLRVEGDGVPLFAVS